MLLGDAVGRPLVCLAGRGSPGPEDPPSLSSSPMASSVKPPQCPTPLCAFPVTARTERPDAGVRNNGRLSSPGCGVGVWDPAAGRLGSVPLRPLGRVGPWRAVAPLPSLPPLSHSLPLVRSGLSGPKFPLLLRTRVAGSGLV